MSTPDSPPTEPLAVDFGPGLYWLRSGVATAEVVAHFVQDGRVASVVDLEGVADKAGIMEAFGHALGFPGWVGRNWDALDDALGDLSWWPAGPRGRLVLVRGADPDGPGTREERQMLRDVLETAVASWALTNSPLVVLLRR
jgi:hypothetical protein